MGQAWEGLRKRVPAWGSEGGGQDGIASDTEAEAWGGRSGLQVVKGGLETKQGCLPTSLFLERLVVPSFFPQRTDTR